MVPEGSLPHSQFPATCPFPEPARSHPYPHILLLFFFRCLGRTRVSVQVRGSCKHFVTGYVFTVTKVLAPLPTTKLEDHPLVGCPRVAIAYIRSYPPYWKPFLHPQP